jgi:hypothetical protein
MINQTNHIRFIISMWNNTADLPSSANRRYEQYQLRNPGKVVRRMQNVSDHILAEIQLFRRGHGTTCSPNHNSFLLSPLVKEL